MPDYYLITEERDEPEETVYDHRKYKKPLPCNLLLPSVHVSRDDNMLLVDSDAQGAVEALVASCSDAGSWPSLANSTMPSCSAAAGHNNIKLDTNHQSVQFEWGGEHGMKLETEPLNSTVRCPSQTKPRLPSLAYDAVDPDILNAARGLFFLRRRQQVMYGAGSSWGGPPRIPSDYELFVAWASLSRTEKTNYIIEVGGAFPESPFRSNCLESQRAVDNLHASCLDSHTWPSVQYSRAQAYLGLPHRPPAPPREPFLNPPSLNYKFK